MHLSQNAYPKRKKGRSSIFDRAHVTAEEHQLQLKSSGLVSFRPKLSPSPSPHPITRLREVPDPAERQTLNSFHERTYKFRIPTRRLESQIQLQFSVYGTS